MYKHDYNFAHTGGNGRVSDEHRRGSILPAANAAEVLAQLHHQRPEIVWEPENVSLPHPLPWKEVARFD
jgi:hypothetical protein